MITRNTQICKTYSLFLTTPPCLIKNKNNITLIANRSNIAGRKNLHTTFPNKQSSQEKEIEDLRKKFDNLLKVKKKEITDFLDKSYAMEIKSEQEFVEKTDMYKRILGPNSIFKIGRFTVEGFKAILIKMTIQALLTISAIYATAHAYVRAEYGGAPFFVAFIILFYNLLYALSPFKVDFILEILSWPSVYFSKNFWKDLLLSILGWMSIGNIYISLTSKYISPVMKWIAVAQYLIVLLNPFKWKNLKLNVVMFRWFITHSYYGLRFPLIRAWFQIISLVCFELVLPLIIIKLKYIKLDVVNVLEKIVTRIKDILNKIYEKIFGKKEKDNDSEKTKAADSKETDENLIPAKENPIPEIPESSGDENVHVATEIITNLKDNILNYFANFIDIEYPRAFVLKCFEPIPVDYFMAKFIDIEYPRAFILKCFEPIPVDYFMNFIKYIENFVVDLYIFKSFTSAEIINILNNNTSGYYDAVGYFFYITHWLPFLIPLLIAIAYVTLIERHVIGAIQRRQGPNVIGIYGLLQPLADGFKLFLKETILPRSSNLIIFILAPVFTFGLALAAWIVIPFGDGMYIATINISLLYIFAISSLSVHSVIMAGWSSNSKYAFLGALRSAAQMISYEVSMGVTIISVVLLAGSLNFVDIVNAQQNLWYCLPLFPMFLIFFICTLAETNRHPFDLPEAEAELVSGYNVEYSAMGFALFFLAEYSNIILMCSLTSILFLGGWYIPVLKILTSITILQPIWFAVKTWFFILLFIIIRAAVPRFRYDQLMRLGWKVFLPISLGYLFVLSSILIAYNCLPF